MLERWLCVGFTGHRRLSNSASVQVSIANALDRLAVLGRLAATTSAACGSDTLFLEELSRREIPYFILLPTSIDRFRADFSAEDWQRVSRYFPSALNIEVVEATGDDDGNYLEAGVLVADQADVVIAVWNGKPAQGVGGTGDIVEYCRALEKPLVLIDSETGVLTEERLEHLTTVDDPVELAGASVASRLGPREIVDQQYEILDREANLQAPNSRSLIVQLVFLHLFATAVPLVVLTLHLSKTVGYWASVIKLVALLSAVWLARRHHRAHQHWMSSRLRAEACRAFQSIWGLRRHRSAEPKINLPHCDHQLKQLRILWYLGRHDAVDLESAKLQYMNQRIRHQQAYYRQAGGRAKRANQRLRRTAYLVTLTAILAAFIYLLGGWFVNENAFGLKLTKLLSILLPLVSAALLSVIAAHDLNRRTNRYEELAEALQTNIVRISAVRSWPGLWRVVSDTESLLLHELSEWHAMTHYAGNEH